MASYNELLALIDAYINQNGVQAITGQVLNGVLRAMVDQLGRGYSIMGAADPTTDPGTPDGPETWFASVPGTYTNFDGIQIVPGELALLSYVPSDGFSKNTIYEGFQAVQATADDNIGYPQVGVSYANGVLSFDFRNIKGEPGENGQDGDPAGFGTVNATVDDQVGTPSVSVSSSGPDTAKNFTFAFRNLKGETGVTSVLATVDNTSGNPQCTVSLQNGQLTLAFTGLKGAQGDTGSSVDYPFTIVNNLTTNDATQALSAAMGVQLESEVSQLEAKPTYLSIVGDGTPTLLPSNEMDVTGFSKVRILFPAFADLTTINATTILMPQYHIPGQSWAALTQYNILISDLPGLPKYLDVSLPAGTEDFRLAGNYLNGETVTYTVYLVGDNVNYNFSTGDKLNEEILGAKNQYENEYLGKYIGVYTTNRKIARFNGSGETLFTAENAPEGTKILYKLTVAKKTDATNLYIELLDSSEQRLAIYGKTSAAASVSDVFDGDFTIPSGFSYARIMGSAYGTINYILSADNLPDIVKRIQSLDVVKEVGYFANKLSFAKPANASYVTIPLFTSADVSVGDVLAYSLDLVSGVGVNAYIELLDSNNSRLAIYGKTSVGGSTTHFDGTFSIPSGFSYAHFRGSATGVINYVRGPLANINLLSRINSGDAALQAQIENLQDAISSISGVNNAKYITRVGFSTTPITILSNKDEDATQYDNALVNFSCILKVSETMYYLYYTCYGKTDTITDPNQHLAFAYSTDGFHYTRGFPDGVTAPIPGTNLIALNNMIEMQVFKVNDYAYPYRMVANKAVGDVTQIVTLFKSADAINWTEVKELTAGGNDTQTSVVVRGNTLKLFIRMYNNGRRVGVLYCDLEGNLLSAPTIVIMDENTLYMAAASALDNHREVLFPTKFDPDTDEESMVEYILNGERYDQVTLNTSTLLSAEDKSVYACPGMVNIGLNMYLLYAVRDSTHGSYDKNTTKSSLKLAKATFINNVND